MGNSARFYYFPGNWNFAGILLLDYTKWFWLDNLVEEKTSAEDMEDVVRGIE